jgi:hypothetical protein
MADIGYTTIGSSGRALNGGVKGMKVTMAEDGEAGVTITARLSDSATGDSFRAAIVNATDNDTVIASSTIRTDISTAGWYTFSGGGLATFQPANGVTYMLTVGSDSAANAQIYHDADTATVHTGWSGAVTTIDPFEVNGVGADATRDYSIYMTYTPDAGGSIVPILNQYRRRRQ